jgi:hypothetical protein
VENTLGHNGQQGSSATSQWLLIVLAGVVMAVMVAVLIARLTGYQADSTPTSAVIDMREIGFRDLPRRCRRGLRVGQRRRPSVASSPR